MLCDQPASIDPPAHTLVQPTIANPLFISSVFLQSNKLQGRASLTLCRKAGQIILRGVVSSHVILCPPLRYDVMSQFGINHRKT
jgi:hypothetical protein